MTRRTIPAELLSDDELLCELAEMHRTRHVTLRHGSDAALEEHTRRCILLEAEYLTRWPRREVGLVRSWHSRLTWRRARPAGQMYEWRPAVAGEEPQFTA